MADKHKYDVAVIAVLVFIDLVFLLVFLDYLIRLV